MVTYMSFLLLIFWKQPDRVVPTASQFSWCWALCQIFFSGFTFIHIYPTREFITLEHNRLTSARILTWATQWRIELCWIQKLHPAVHYKFDLGCCKFSFFSCTLLIGYWSASSFLRFLIIFWQAALGKRLNTSLLMIV